MLSKRPTVKYDYNIRTPLRDAIDTQDVRQVRATLKSDGLGEGLGLRLAASDAMTLWVNGGSPAILKALLLAGLGEPYTDACLGNAVGWGVVDAVRMLIAAGVSESARDGALVKASEWMRDRAERGARVSPSAHAEIVRMLLAAGTTKSARDHAVGKAATYGDAWMVWVLRAAGVSAQAVSAAKRQAQEYQEQGVLDAMEPGADEPPMGT